MAAIVQEVRFSSSTIVELERQIAMVKSDNVKLYEKIRYIQAYQGQTRHRDTRSVSQPCRLRVPLASPNALSCLLLERGDQHQPFGFKAWWRRQWQRQRQR